MSEPLMTRRKVQDDVETGGNSLTRDEPGGWPDCCPGGIRREGGVTLNQGSVAEVRIRRDNTALQFCLGRTTLMG